MTQPAGTPTSPPTPAQPGRGPSRGLILGGVLLALVIFVLLGWYAAAQSAYQRSFSTSATLQDRVSAAEQASRMVPFDARYRTRAVVMAGWLKGKQQLDAQDWSGAVATLAAAYKLDIGDSELLALFKTAQDDQRIKTNWKAHSQHAHEGPGGTLRPQDVIK